MCTRIPGVDVADVIMLVVFLSSYVFFLFCSVGLLKQGSAAPPPPPPSRVLNPYEDVVTTYILVVTDF